jgi:pilus assembly protein CpaB
MNAQKIFTTVAIIGLAAIGGLMARSLFTPAGESIQANALATASTPYVLVATEDLNVGAFVDPNSLTWREWPETSLMPTHLRRGSVAVNDLVGAVVRDRISAGEPVIHGKLVRPGERGFLAAVLSPGTRAVSVAVNAVSGNAGLIFPGDRVDIILTQTLENHQEDPGNRMVGETVVRHARVIAVDQRVSPQEAKEGHANPVARTITLEVTPQQAEIVTVSAELGRLNLSLRSLANAEGVEDEALKEVTLEDLALPTSPTWAYEVSSALTKARAYSKKSRVSVRVMRGGKSETVSN